jgi:hypothetical protein
MMTGEWTCFGNQESTNRQTRFSIQLPPQGPELLILSMDTKSIARVSQAMRSPIPG